MSRSRFLTFVVFVSMVMTLVPLGQRAATLSTSIVISQVYAGGGNAGATLRNDFIELFNRGTTTVSITGWSVQYAAAAGSTWQRTSLSGTIAPGQYYLVQEAQGTGGTVHLPDPDATGTIPMGATAGKVVLLDSDALIAAGTSCPSDRVDLVGYGTTANCFEGTGPTPAPSNTTAVIRGPAATKTGCQETDINSADFTTGSPSPRNTASPRNLCSAEAAPFVAATVPSDGAIEVAADANIIVTFSEPVVAAGGAFMLTCTRSGALTLVVIPSGASTTYVLDPQTNLQPNEVCTVTVEADLVTDVDDVDPPNNMADDYTFTFSTTGLALRIHDIQGAAHISPHDGDFVSQVPGIVTVLAPNGFWIQDPAPDTDVRTSEGIFVFTSSAPTVAIGGDVRVSGRVQEFRPGCVPSCDSTGSAYDNLTTTEIESPITTTIGLGAILPTLIGVGGRVPPTTVIENDSAPNVESGNTFDPNEDGIDFYESLEGTLVQINDAVAVGPRNSFGEIPVLSDNGSVAGVRTTRGGIVVGPTDFNPERMILDDLLRATPSVNVGDHFTTSVQAVVDYNFDNFKFLVTDVLTAVDGGLVREQTQVPGYRELAVATFNVENLDPHDSPSKFAALAGLIVNNLRAPDLLAIEEIQDNTGPGADPSTNAALTWEMLIAAIEVAGGPTYDYRQIDPLFNQDGGEPNGNIRQGFLFRTDRGLEFVDRLGGTAITATHASGSRKGAQLTFSPGRIDPTNAAFANSRKPLAGEFRWNGKTFFAIANHFNSKGGDDPLFGRFQPPQRSSEGQRHQQAAIVNAFVDELLAADKHARIVVLGDINDFEFSQTLDILKGGVLVGLMETLPRAERYSYVFDGNSQVLDQILVSARLFKSVEAYDSVHVNAEFADQDSDHDPQVARLRFGEGDDDGGGD
jgi:uncharacterized protein